MPVDGWRIGAGQASADNAKKHVVGRKVRNFASGSFPWIRGSDFFRLGTLVIRGRPMFDESVQWRHRHQGRGHET